LAGVLRLVLRSANKKNGLSHPASGGEYELVGSTARKLDEDERGLEPEDAEETLIGGARKMTGENAGFRYML